MDKVIYSINCSFDLKDTVTSVKDLENELNGHLATFGYSEQIRIGFRQPYTIGTISVDRELNESEIDKMKQIFQEQLSNSPGLSGYGIKVDSICKSSSQSSSKSSM